MPEEVFDVVNLFWSDEFILNGRLANGKIVRQYMTRAQVDQVHSLQAAHDIELQRLLRSFVSE